MPRLASAQPRLRPRLSPGPAGEAYLPSSAASRATFLTVILGAHALALLALVSLGGVVAVVQHARPMLVALLPEPTNLRPPPTPSPPVPQMRTPDLVVPEPPRIDVIQAVQAVERPAPPPPPAPVRAAPVAAPVAPPALEPPRFGLAYLNNPGPAYPVFSKRAREQGVVKLRVKVDAAGNVEGIEIHESSGYERLDRAALAAVRHWRFVPARQGDRAVAGVALVPIRFELET